MSMLRSSLYKNTSIFFKNCDFSWEGGGTLPHNSYKPSLRRTRLVQRLARSLGTAKQTDILLLYYKDLICTNYVFQKSCIVWKKIMWDFTALTGPWLNSSYWTLKSVGKDESLLSEFQVSINYNTDRHTDGPNLKA
jgi:hypothetical protein